MMATVNQFTKLEQEAYIEQHPKAEPKEWAVMDGRLVLGFYDKLEDAQREAKENRRKYLEEHKDDPEIPYHRPRNARRGY